MPYSILYFLDAHESFRRIYSCLLRSLGFTIFEPCRGPAHEQFPNRLIATCSDETYFEDVILLVKILK